MKTITESVEHLFKTEDIKYDQPEDESVYRLHFRGHTGNYVTWVFVDEEDRFLTAHTLCPFKVPKTKRVHVLELLARINWRLEVGNFDIDLKDGEIICRVSVRIGGIELDDGTVSWIVFGSVARMDRFFPAIAAVVYGNASPQKALAMLPERGDAPDEVTDGDEPLRRGFGGRVLPFSDN